MSEPFRWHLSPYRKFIPEALRSSIPELIVYRPGIMGLLLIAVASYFIGNGIASLVLSSQGAAT